jgi:hypothetical protein
MNRLARRCMPLLLSLPLLLAACGKPENLGKLSAAGEPAPAAAAAPKGNNTQQAEPQRYLAVRHSLRLQTEPDTVETAWKAAQDACNAAGCDVLESGVEHGAGDQPAHAMLDARVPPAKLDAFLAKVTALGSVGEHRIAAEDKTDEVLDIEARQKNMADYRDNLRRMLATPNAKLSDLMEVERELTRVQGDLDSLASRRKALANLTEKVRVTLQIAPRPSVIERGTWSPVTRSFQRAGHVLADSLSTLIDVTLALLPWLLAVGALLAVFKAWRRRRRGR